MSDKHLTLYDIRDLDLMMMLAESGNGGVSSKELAETLGMGNDQQAVGIRCAWMRRFGFFQFDEKRRLWSLAPAGERIVQAKQQAAGISIDNVPDESMVDVMAHVTARYRRGDPIVATMLRREFMFGTSPRSKAWA